MDKMGSSWFALFVKFLGVQIEGNEMSRAWERTEIRRGIWWETSEAKKALV